MSKLISQLLLAILLFPLASLVYLTSFHCLDEYSPMTSANCHGVAGAITWVLGGTYWVFLWRSSIPWNFRRVAGTVVLVLVAATISIVTRWLLQHFIRDWEYRASAMVTTSVLAPLLWAVGTVFLWRETKAELSERLRRSRSGGLICPVCGYDLTGLTQTRCPECGTGFTLDELVAAQPARASRELEAG